MTIPTLNAQSAEHLLSRSVIDLSQRFAGVFIAETFDRYVHESYQSLYRAGSGTGPARPCSLRTRCRCRLVHASHDGRHPKPSAEPTHDIVACAAVARVVEDRLSRSALDDVTG